MAWSLLAAAVGAEIAFAFALKLSRGFAEPLWTGAAALAGLASVALLTLAARDLPIGTAYPIWTGLAGAGVVIIGVLALGEAATALKLASVAAILVGVAGLRLAA